MDTTSKNRTIYLLALIATIILGPCSRLIHCLPKQTGDALWAIAVFLCLRLLLMKKKIWIIAVASLVISYLDEFSQLIQWEWLKPVRENVIGHLLLGQGFLVMDLVAYTIGIGLIYLIVHYWEEYTS